MTADRGPRITIETERVLFLVRKHSIRGWCERCGQEVDLAGVGELAKVLEGVSLQGSDKSETRLHLERARDGLAVCLKSLLLVVRGSSGR